MKAASDPKQTVTVIDGVLEIGKNLLGNGTPHPHSPAIHLMTTLLAPKQFANIKNYQWAAVYERWCWSVNGVVVAQHCLP